MSEGDPDEGVEELSDGFGPPSSPEGEGPGVRTEGPFPPGHGVVLVQPLHWTARGVFM